MSTIRFHVYLITFSFFTFGFFFVPTFSFAANECSFTRQLEVGIDGEDVRCLQRYLNATGFVIADSGPGSPSNETSLFRDKTKEAVIRWQIAKKITPASGIFGQKSQAAYLIDQVALLRPPVTTTPVVVQAPSPTPQVAGISTSQPSKLQAELEQAILDAIDIFEDAENEIEDARDEGRSTDGFEDDLNDARDELFAAIRSYFDEDWEDGLGQADDAFDAAEDAFSDAGGETEEDDAEELLDEVNDALKDAEEEIEDAKDDDKDTDDAEDYLDDAENTLNDAEDAFDDEDYDEAIDLAEEAEDLIDDALDAIGDSDDESDAEDALDDAQNAYDDAKDEIEEAEDDGDDVEDALDLLDEAKDLLDDAEDAFDDEDYDEVLDLVEEAEDLIDEALDEI
ncbi:MAG: peptidoglycan-binding protein [Patescibacteria group bacterium]